MKYRTNITASSNKRTPAHTRARYRRATLRRSRIENGVVRVQFIKVLPPAAPVAALPEPSPEPFSEADEWGKFLGIDMDKYRCNEPGCNRIVGSNEAYCAEHHVKRYGPFEPPKPEPARYYTDSGENPAQWTPGEGA